VAFLQQFWRALGTWKRDDWRLPFAVWRDGDPVGVQELEARNFAVLRTVESSSFLVPEARGKRIGQEMRRAVLSLAFDHLGGEVATSGAWEDNAASLGVSRAVGYVANGWHRHEDRGRVGALRSVILEKKDWTPATDIEVEGLEGCRDWFGV
jgi:RimJ/RimL family protein N-acetyltransferase